MIFNVPAHGHMNVTIPVVAELVQRGHTVIYYCGENFRETIEHSGATFENYPNTIPSSQAISQKAHNLANISLLLLEASQSLIPFAIEEIQREQPDIVIYDVINLWARVATHVTQTRTVATFPVMILEQVNGLFDLRTIVYMMISAVPKLPRLLRLRYQLVQKWGQDALKFPLFPSVGQLNLVFMSRQFQIDTPFIDDSFRFVGASIRPNLRVGSPLTFQEMDKPRIYISLGTVNNRNLRFFKETLSAFKDYPAQFIMSIGHNISEVDLQPVPDNFCIMNSVPQLEVLQQTDVFITHGGMNSVQEALYYSVPQIVVPQQLEQAINGRRVQELGAGLILGATPPYGTVDIKALHDAVDAILNQPHFKQNAQKQGKLSRDSGGYLKAVDEIEAFLASQD